MKYPILEPTPENRGMLLKALTASPSQLSYISETVLDGLLKHPFARPAFLWRYGYVRSALSPFALAGISQIPPREVIKKLEEEGTFTHIELCTTVQLPVCYLSYNIAYDRWSKSPVKLDKEPYETGLDEAEEGEREWGDPYRSPRTPPWKKRTLEWMLNRYGGKTWRRHCKRIFDPFRAREGDYFDHISLKQWNQLKKVYWLNQKGEK